MPTLYVENVPEDLYRALRERARERHRSIAAEVVFLLEKAFPPPGNFAPGGDCFENWSRYGPKKLSSGKSFPSTGEMQRQDRAR